MKYFGWLDEWFDGDGDPIVSELLIKFHVNKYFDFPEDWDSDDVPLIMIFIRCKICDMVHSHYIREDCINLIYNSYFLSFSYMLNLENFVYNFDNTFTSLSHKVRCHNCGVIWTYKLDQFETEDSLSNTYRINTIKFDSVLEEYFWQIWNEKSKIILTPQYKIGKYRVDFAHLPTKTVIELDGKAYHSSPQQKAYDGTRQSQIERQGWQFLRFDGLQVFSDPETCIISVLNFLGQ